MTEPAALAAAALARVAAVVGELSPAQLEDLVAGRARLVLEPGQAGDTDPTPTGRRRGSRQPAGGDVAAAVEAINRLTSARAVAEFLEREGFSVPVLREIAAALGPTVSAAARSKAGLQRNIAEGTVGFRTRSASMSGGAWS